MRGGAVEPRKSPRGEDPFALVGKKERPLLNSEGLAVERKELPPKIEAGFELCNCVGESGERYPGSVVRRLVSFFFETGKPASAGALRSRILTALRRSPSRVPATGGFFPSRSRSPILGCQPQLVKELLVDLKVLGAGELLDLVFGKRLEKLIHVFQNGFDFGLKVVGDLFVDGRGR